MTSLKFAVAIVVLVLATACGAKNPMGPSETNASQAQATAGPAVRATLGSTIGVWNGSPDCYLGCAPAVKIEYDADQACYPTTRSDASKSTYYIRVNGVNPRQPNRTITITTAVEFNSIQAPLNDHFGELDRPASLVSENGFGLPSTKGKYTVRFNMLEMGSDVPSGGNTDSAPHTFCVN